MGLLLASLAQPSPARIFSRLVQGLPKHAAASVWRHRLPRHIRPTEVARRSLTTGTSGNEKTFGEKCKTAAADAILQGLLATTSGFDATFAGLKITDVGTGTVDMGARPSRSSVGIRLPFLAELLVESKMQNPFGKMHGGALCTLVDIAGTAALMSLSPTQPGVSVDLNISFLSAADVGTTLLVVGKVEKHGQKLGFTDVRISEKASGRLQAPLPPSARRAGEHGWWSPPLCSGTKHCRMKNCCTRSANANPSPLPG